VLDQTFKDFELIILDDCSTDNSYQIALSFSDPRVRAVRLEKNMRGTYTHNKLYELSEGKYIKYLHHDDLLMPNALEEFVVIIDRYDDVGLVTSTAEFINAKGESLGIFPWALGQNKLWAVKEMLTFSVRLGNIIGNPTNCMFRKSELSHDPFDYKVNLSGDWLTILDVNRSCLCYSTSQALVKYRVHPDSNSFKNAGKFVLQDYYVINQFDSAIGMSKMVSSSWRLHLQGIWQLIYSANSEYVDVLIKYIEDFMQADKYIECYDESVLVRDLQNLLRRLHEEGKSAIVSWSANTESVLYRWFFQYSMPVTFEFFSYLRNTIVSLTQSRVLLIGASIETIQFLRQFSNYGIQIVGAYDINGNMSAEINQILNGRVYRQLDMNKYDAFLIISPDRLTDFKVEFEMRKIINSNGLSHFPIVRLREWLV
jgi:glycosyltransferase involved in cell wall biosynthesis